MATIIDFDGNPFNCYTKKEVIVMLEELKSEFEKYEPKWVGNDDQAIASCRTWEDLDEIIQQKIDKLREG